MSRLSAIPCFENWRDQAPPQLRRNLESYLGHRIPGARLQRQTLPQVPEIALHLINDDYPRDNLNAEQAAALMDHPPFWGFCWGSGQALARWLLDHSETVAGKTLVDLGSGSGIVGIAAGIAGAQRVILCDQDNKALAAAKLNADDNGVTVEFCQSLEALLPARTPVAGAPGTLVAVADVFYDRDNLPLLPLLIDRFDSVMVADSRLKGQALPGMEIIARLESHTVPDLEESPEFNRITLYRSVPVALNNQRAGIPDNLH